jgi:hypothetical protein
MTTRADMIETAARALCAQDSEDWEEVQQHAYREDAAAVLDAVLPQITTVEQLRALPKRTWLLTAIDDTPHLLLRGAMDDKHLESYLSVYGPLTVWQQPTQQKPADA